MSNASFGRSDTEKNTLRPDLITASRSSRLGRSGSCCIALAGADWQRLVDDESGELQYSWCGLVWKTPGRCQLGNSMDHRPCEKRELMRISRGQAAFLLTVFDEVLQRPKGLFCGFGIARIVPLCSDRRIEHHREMFWSAQSKFHIGQSGALQSNNAAAMVFDSVQHSLIQLPESLGGHGRQEIFLFRKVAVRSVVGDARASCHFSQSKASRPNLGN